jgi:hypothetical protein
MHNDYQHQQPRNKGPSDPKAAFASVIAAMVALFLGPPISNFAAPYVFVMAQQSYAPELVDLITIGFMLLCYPATYLAARAVIVAALRAIGVYLAYRLF